MSKISAYATAVPVAADSFLGNQASGPTTKRFLASDTTDLILGAFGGKTTSLTGAGNLVIETLNICSGTAPYTVTLPNPSGNAGKRLGILITASLAGMIKVNQFAAETIDGAAARYMWQYESAILYCDGTNWFKVGGKSIGLTTVLKNTAGLAAQAVNTGIYPTFDTQVSGPALMYSASLGLCPRTGTYLIACSGVFSTASLIPTFATVATAVAGANIPSAGSVSYLPSGNFQNVIGMTLAQVTQNQSIGSYFYVQGTGTFSVLAGTSFSIQIAEVLTW